MQRHLLITLILSAIFLAVPSALLACGFFAELPIDQTAERIIFTIKETAPPLWRCLQL
jgi:hypothetical protein